MKNKSFLLVLGFLLPFAAAAQTASEWFDKGSGNGKQIIWRAVEVLEGSANFFKIDSLQYGTSPDPFADLMVRIKGGTFQMGDNYGDDDEQPLHSVAVSSFSMCKYEVTQKQWREVMGEDPPKLYFKNCDNCPVENISWNDIQEFLQKLNTQTGKNYRLPTEAEWEYACRAGTTTPFNTGDNLTTAQANYDGNYPWKIYPKGEYRQKTTPAGSFAPNAWGLYDMHGNVFEWCQDVWHDDYNGAPNNDSSWTSSGDSSDRVLRGGSWNYLAGSCRSAYRLKGTSYNRYFYYGFRLTL